MKHELIPREAVVLRRVVSDLKFYCNRHTNGECMSLVCLSNGGYERGTKPDYSVATCEVHEQVTVLESVIANIITTAKPDKSFADGPVEEGPIERSPGEPDVENKLDWLAWCMGRYQTTDRAWCAQRWITTATRGQLPPRA